MEVKKETRSSKKRVAEGEECEKKVKTEQSWLKMEAAKDKMRQMFADYRWLVPNTAEFSTFWHDYEMFRIETEDAADRASPLGPRDQSLEAKDAWLAVNVVNACHLINPIEISKLEEVWSKIDPNKCKFLVDWKSVIEHTPTTDNIWYETIERQMRSLELAALLYVPEPPPRYIYKPDFYMERFRADHKVRIYEGMSEWLTRQYKYFETVIAPVYKDRDEQKRFDKTFRDSVERILMVGLGEDNDFAEDVFDELRDQWDWETPGIDIRLKNPYNKHVNWIQVWDHLTEEQKVEQRKIRAKELAFRYASA